MGCFLRARGARALLGHRAFFAAAALLGCVVGGALGCSGKDPSPVVLAPFVAFESDFQDFHSWESFAITMDIAPGNDHLNGPRHLFLNKRPPAGSHEFPVGTIMVKESDGDDPTARHIFAMVKRGADFNVGGALNWEWFELANASSGAVVIKWRGFGPSNGDAYGGDATGGCNACHKTAAASDYVFTGPTTAMIGK